MGLLGLALVLNRGRRNGDVFMEQQHPVGSSWSESVPKDASSQPAAFSLEEWRNNCLSRELSLSSQTQGLHLPGAATTAWLWWWGPGGAQQQPGQEGRAPGTDSFGKFICATGGARGGVSAPSLSCCSDLHWKVYLNTYINILCYFVSAWEEKKIFFCIFFLKWDSKQMKYVSMGHQHRL